MTTESPLPWQRVISNYDAWQRLKRGGRATLVLCEICMRLLLSGYGCLDCSPSRGGMKSPSSSRVWAYCRGLSTPPHGATEPSSSSKAFLSPSHRSEISDSRLELFFKELRGIGTEFCWFWNFHINCYNFIIFLLCILHHKIEKKIRGATAPKNQDRLKRLLPDGSTGGLVVSKALIPQS